MSYIVESENEIVWEPSRRVGNYFLDSIQLLENLLEINSGVTSNIADEIQIDAAEFDGFTRRVMQKVEETNNTPLFAMISGLVEIIVALNFRINNSVPEKTANNRLITQRADKIFYPLSDYLAANDESAK